MTWIKKTARWGLRLSIAILALFLIVWVGIRFPVVQNFLAQTAAGQLSQKLQTKVSVGRVDIEFIKTAVIREVFVEDRQQDTLLYAGKLGVDIGLFSLLRRKIHLNSVEIKDTRFKLYTLPGSDTLNLQFLIDAFSGNKEKQTDKKGNPWTIGLSGLELEKVLFSLKNKSIDIKAGVKKGLIELDQLDLTQQQIKVSTINLDGAEAFITQLKKIAAEETVEPVAVKDRGKTGFPFAGWLIQAKNLVLKNSRAVIWNDNYPLQATGMDYLHMDFREASIRIEDYVWNDSIMKASIHKAALKERSGIALQDLEAEVAMSPTFIKAENLKIKTEASEIENSTVLRFPEFGDLSDYLNKVVMESRFVNTRVAFQDLKYFVPGWEQFPVINTQLDRTIRLQGQIRTGNDAVQVNSLGISIGKDLDLELEGRIGELQGGGAFDLAVRRLATSSVGLQRLTKGLPVPEQLGDIRFRSRITGTFDSLHLAHTKLETSGATRFEGNLAFKELSASPFRFQVQAEALEVEWPVIEELAGRDLPANLDSLGLIRFRGDIQGDPFRFHLKGRFVTDAGWIEGPLQMSFEEDYSSAGYSGELEINDFDLSHLAGSGFGRTGACVQFAGRGFQPEEMDLKWNLQTDSLIQGKYTYRDIFIDGELDHGDLQLEGVIFDTNLLVQFAAEGCPFDSFPEIAARLRIDSANIQALGFTGYPIDLQGEIAMDLRGFQLDRHQWQLNVTDLLLKNNSLTHITPSLTASSIYTADNDHHVRVQSNFLNVQSDGHYYIREAGRLTEAIVNHYFPVKGLLDEDILPDTVLRQLLDETYITFDGGLENAEDFFAILLPGLENLASASLTGDLEGEKRRFRIAGLIPALSYQGTTIDSATLLIQGDSSALTIEMYVDSAASGAINIPPTALVGRFANEKLAFDLNMDEGPDDKLVRVGGDIHYDAPFYRLTLDRQFITVNTLWDVPQGNEVSWKKGLLQVRDLSFRKGEQLLQIHTLPLNAKEEQPPLEIQLSGLHVGELIGSFVQDNQALKGIAGGRIRIFELDKDPYYRGNLDITNLSVGEKPLGDLSVLIEQAQKTAVLDVGLSLKGSQNDLEISGTYQPDRDHLDLQINLKKMDAGIIDLFAAGQLDETAGQISGKLDLRGSVQEPVLTGNLTMNGVSTRIDISNTVYHIDDQAFAFEKNKIVLGRFSVREKQGRKAEIWGTVSHHYFRDFVLDLNYQTSGFQVLNTTKKDNDLFYGNLFISADGRLRGPLNNLVLVTGAKTLPGSDITVLAYGVEEEVQQENYIIFGNPYQEGAGSAVRDERLLSKFSSGFAVETNLEITPDMKLNIVLDPESGDRLECAGQANIAVQVDSKGKLGILGNYVFTRGSYYFSYEGLVKKEFVIQQGSNLAFLGNPYDTRFDITAVYGAKTAIYSLIDGRVTLSDTEITRSQKPTDVFLDLLIRGNLDEPELSFDIRVPDPGDGTIKNAVDWKLADLRQRPNALNTQVFSVMFFNSFIPEEGAGGDNLSSAAETAAFSSLRSFATGQLNKFADQLIKGVDISFDIDAYTSGTIEGGNTEIITELGVKVSKSLFNDRLSIEVGSNVNVKRQDAMAFNTSDFSGIAGDFVLEYKLNEQGNYLVKVYHLNEYDILYDGTDYKTGISFVLRKKLGKKAREERRKRKEIAAEQKKKDSN